MNKFGYQERKILRDIRIIGSELRRRMKVLYLCTGLIQRDRSNTKGENTTNEVVKTSSDYSRILHAVYKKNGKLEFLRKQVGK